MTTRLQSWTWIGATMLALAGCYRGTDGDSAGAGATEGADGVADGDGGSADAGDDVPGADSGAPGHQGEGDADDPPGRAIRRMTAEQFHRSLQTATGQAWPSFGEYAATMGKADFAEITEEGRGLSVTFDKFAHDAATFTCDAAVDLEVSDTPPSPALILRRAQIGDRDEATLRDNLDYLMLRFLGQVMQPDDTRVDPWLTLLTAPTSEGDGELTDEIMADRWKAVCVGLATHPDFVTY